MHASESTRKQAQAKRKKVRPRASKRKHAKASAGPINAWRRLPNQCEEAFTLSMRGGVINKSRRLAGTRAGGMCLLTPESAHARLFTPGKKKRPTIRENKLRREKIWNTAYGSSGREEKTTLNERTTLFRCITFAMRVYLSISPPSFVSCYFSLSVCLAFALSRPPSVCLRLSYNITSTAYSNSSSGGGNRSQS